MLFAQQPQVNMQLNEQFNKMAEYIRDNWNNCIRKKYYRYREDGSWTLETENDLKNNSAYACVAGTEGVEYIMLPRPREPGIIFKRTSVECDPVVEPNGIIEEECYCSDALVEYVFGRYEKK